MQRRTFLKAGVIGSSLTFSDLSFADAPLQDKSVIWVWLGGGPTQFETFHAPTDAVPDIFQPVDGFVTHPNGLAFGGLFKQLIQRGDKLTSVNSFSHRDSSHRQATQFMQTGQYNAKRDQTAGHEFPGHGAIVSSIFGANHPHNGVPTYVKQGRIEGEDPAFLGGAFKPFDPSSKDNLIPKVKEDRFKNRKELLDNFDKSRRFLSATADSFTKIGDQAYSVVLGTAKDAFDLEQESDSTKEKYGKSSVGTQLLLARRLSEFGTKFVTVHYGGWDVHSNISNAMRGKVPPLDQALAALVDDLEDRGMTQDTMLVVTGEFGRTKLNANSGRDHWPSITTLLLAGGNYSHGRVIGKADKAYYPTSDKYGPLDLSATIFDHFGIDPKIQKIDQAGRPRYLLDGEARVILG